MISLVIPVYNEEKLIDELFERVRNSMKTITDDFEVIFVDDGSTDNSFEKLKSCNTTDKRFKVLALSRNFGHQSAYTAGLHYAKGDIIAMMDGDLQDPPELLAEMNKKLTSEPVDIVYGKRMERNEKSSKKIFISIFHNLFNQLSHLENIKQVGNFSMMTRKALNALLTLKEKNRYLPGLRSFIGFKQGYVEYSRPERVHGEAKMTFTRLMGLAFDAIFSFSNLPVKICLYSGLIGILLIFLAVVYILVGKITGMAPLGWSSIIMSIYFIGSVQLLSIGILGEYVYRIYKESQNRPIFLVNYFIE
ncbi:MAG: glycosyltransferase family 2 protein [Flavisolibacter sp.]